MRNGPNGISLFIVSRFSLKFNEKNIISAIPATAPTQKDKMTALAPRDNPKNQPIPRASFPSPNPIHLPPEKNHNRKNGEKSIGPDRNGRKVGIEN